MTNVYNNPFLICLKIQWPLKIYSSVVFCILDYFFAYYNTCIDPLRQMLQVLYLEQCID